MKRRQFVRQLLKEGCVTLNGARHDSYVTLKPDSGDLFQVDCAIASLVI